MNKTIRTRQLPGSADEAERPYEHLHRIIARQAAADGMVLLKNSHHVLPIAAGSRIALYGPGAVVTIKGGIGSGDVNSRPTVNIYQGLKEAGYVITTADWCEQYKKDYDAARLAWKEEIWKKIDASDAGETGGNRFFQAYSTTVLKMPEGGEIQATEADTALYVLTRNAGEGADRTAEKGDYYLSDREHEQLKKLTELYDKVVLILNVGGVIDLSILDELDIDAVLEISQPGMEAGHAVADILSGAVTPSARLTDTWALQYTDYPSSATFSSNDGNVEVEPYADGIFVGYRYFDSFDVPVRYGFGYGLSYTTFKIETRGLQSGSMGTSSPMLGVQVKVTNTGQTAGKEVVQVYAGLPQGRLSKEYRRLVGFAKTETLAPGESEEMTVSFPLKAMESYDESRPGWVLEKGTYPLFVGSSLAASKVQAVLFLEDEMLAEKTEHVCPLEADQTLQEIAPDPTLLARRMEQDLAVWKADPALIHNALVIHKADLATRTLKYDGAYDNTPQEVRDFVDTLSTEQLIQLATGDLAKGQGSFGNAGIAVPGSAAQTSDCAKEQGLADIVLSDGPAGLRLNRVYDVRDGKALGAPIEKAMENGFLARDTEEEPGVTHRYQYCTAFPVGTCLAQSWDVRLLQDFGSAVAEEMVEFYTTLWLAPGLNIHRNPLCGRNFEYFSEDPLVSGMMAAAITRGVQSVPGCGTTIKHFACNSQENNRNGYDAVVSERTLREIYVRGFEIAIKLSQPYAIMTAYNVVNGVHAANSYDLCTKLARNEWGFQGAIMTDWLTTSKGATAVGCMQAGNDMIMPGVAADHEQIRQALEDGTLDAKDLKRSIARTVNIIWKSREYE